MKRLLVILYFSACFMGKVNAQCVDNISPVPKALGKHWPYHFRPATECELLFFRKFHPYLTSAFNKTEDYYKMQGWSVQGCDLTMGEADLMQNVEGEKNPFNISLKLMEGSEKRCFSLINDLGYFEWEFTNPSMGVNTNPEIQAIGMRMQELMQTPNIKNTDPEYLKITMQLNQIEDKSKIHVSIPNVNTIKDSVVEKKAKIELMPINGATYIVKIIRDKKVLYAFNDGSNVDNDNHLDELHIYIGKWKAPQIINGTDSQSILVQNNFNLSQPKLSIQNFMIVIKTDASNFDNLIANINFDKMNKLIMQ